MNQEKPKVYLDTTIFSYLVDDRHDVERDIERTIEWWEKEKNEYQVFTSALVVNELRDGNFPNQDQALFLAKTVKALLTVDEIILISN